MEWINYHHLLYFHTVVREGSVAAAARTLHLTPQTVSMQVRELEERLGEELLDRSSRAARPTTAGRLVASYAERIFATGEEMLDALRGRGSSPVPLVAGVSDALPKTVVAQLLTPLLRLDVPVRLLVDECPPDRLLAGLALQQYDFVLSDSPAGTTSRVRCFSHLLGESGVTFVAERELARRLRRGFPSGLDGAPLVLPREGTTLRSLLDRWFDERRIRPRIVAEVVDSALAKALSRAGAGAVAIPSVTVDAVRRQHGLHVVGEPGGLRERFYVISTERRVRHPGVAALLEGARRDLFAAPANPGAVASPKGGGGRPGGAGRATDDAGNDERTDGDAPLPGDGDEGNVERRPSSDAAEPPPGAGSPPASVPPEMSKRRRGR
jgi:LysR family transcriptional activator of nhaA